MTSSADETSVGLMRLVADGDEVAFARIVNAHHADMCSVCFVVTCGDVELTEEAVQAAWPIAWRKLDTRLRLVVWDVDRGGADRYVVRLLHHPI